MAIAAAAILATACQGDANQRTHDRPSPSPPALHSNPKISGEALQAARRNGVDLSEVTGTTIHEVSSLLPGPIPQVNISVDPRRAIPEIGIGGYTDPYSGEVSISLDPRFEEFRHSLRVWLPATIAHEMHHASRVLVGPGYGSTLLEALVTEGLADHFSEELYPSTPRRPWDHALTKNELSDAWTRATKELNSSSYEHDEWFFGAGRIPRWAGYSIGYELVERFLEREDQTASAAVTVRAKTVFARAKYNP